MAGVTFAKPAFWQMIETCDANASILEGETAEDARRGILRTIVHHDDPQVHALLGEQQPDTALEARLLVPRRDHHRTGGPPRGPGGGRAGETQPIERGEPVNAAQV